MALYLIQVQWSIGGPQYYDWSGNESLAQPIPLREKNSLSIPLHPLVILRYLLTYTHLHTRYLHGGHTRERVVQPTVVVGTQRTNNLHTPIIQWHCAPHLLLSMVSISSMNMTVGASLRAILNSAATSLSDSPTYLSIKLLAFTEMKVAPDSSAK